MGSVFTTHLPTDRNHLRNRSLEGMVTSLRPSLENLYLSHENQVKKSCPVSLYILVGESGIPV